MKEVSAILNVLISLIEAYLKEEINFSTFEDDFIQSYFINEKSLGLNTEHLNLFDDIGEKLDFSAETVDPADKEDGILSSDQFKSWLNKRFTKYKKNIDL